jgi:hypothetical protein
MNKFDEFMDEVQNDMRHARFEKYWKLYGKQVLIACIVLLFFSSIYTFSQYRKEKSYIHSSEQFIAAQNALTEGRYDEALAVFEGLINEAPDTYKTLSLFSKVGVLLKKESEADTKQAIDLLKIIEDGKFVDNHFRLFAKLLRYSHQINLLDHSADEFNQMRIDIDKISQQDSTWAYMAKELKGLLLTRLGSQTEAVEIFIKLIQDEKTPQVIRLRSQLMAQLLAKKLVKE